MNKDGGKEEGSICGAEGKLHRDDGHASGWGLSWLDGGEFP